jgi:rfaE bifunctional protein kinase chain/domain/rfaE bifunctional protein nucleotidyltransferase chain/domain
MASRKFPPVVLASKVWPSSEVVAKLTKLRMAGEKIVHCHGVFDVLHPGHLEHLIEAKQLGDFLIVSVTADPYVNKGPGRPVHRLELRLKMLAALEVVDAVVESPSSTALGIIDLVRPDFFVKGMDYSDVDSDVTGNAKLEKDLVEELGGSVHFTSSLLMSSSRIINSQGLTHSSQTEEWLRGFRERFSENEIYSQLDSLRGIKAVVVGEFIADEYKFCEALGKTSKEPVLAFLEEETELQAGGSLAVARHVAGLGAETVLVTRLGKDVVGSWATRAAKNSKIRRVIQESESQMTIVKTRYIERQTGTKVFESYRMTDSPVSEMEDTEFVAMLGREIQWADVVIVCDYGHGLMSDATLEVLQQAQGVVAVNTQSNAGNRGYNSVLRYSRSDIVCLNGGELTLELRKRHGNLDNLIPDLGARTGADWLVVTSGARGMGLWGVEEGLEYMPAFTERVKDRVGAGDALFAMVSLLLASETPPQIVGLLGNLAGSAMVSDLGNRNVLSEVDIRRYVSSIMK